MRLDIAAGTAMRFEPGEEKEVPLVALAGPASRVRPQRQGEWGFDEAMSVKIPRRTYADLYGPTTATACAWPTPS